MLSDVCLELLAEGQLDYGAFSGSCLSVTCHDATYRHAEPAFPGFQDDALEPVSTLTSRGWDLGAIYGCSGIRNSQRDYKLPMSPSSGLSVGLRFRFLGLAPKASAPVKAIE
jgi:hypothetical protein